EFLEKGVRLIRRPSAVTPPLGVPPRRRGHMTGLRHDLKIAFRNLQSKPAFSLMVIGMLALGVAGNAAMFSIFNGFFLRPVPCPHAERLIDLDETAPKWNLRNVGVSAMDFYEWRKSNSTFDSMAFFRAHSYNLSDAAGAVRVDGAQVTREMVDVLGLQPMI